MKKLLSVRVPLPTETPLLGNPSGKENAKL